MWQLYTASENNIIIGASLNVHHNIYRSLDLLTENCPKYVNYSSHSASISKLNLIVFPCFYFQEAGRIKTKSNINWIFNQRYRIYMNHQHVWKFYLQKYFPHWNWKYLEPLCYWPGHVPRTRDNGSQAGADHIVADNLELLNTPLTGDAEEHFHQSLHNVLLCIQHHKSHLQISWWLL